MVTKKAYGLLQIKVVQLLDEHVLTNSSEVRDYFFIEDRTDWNGVVNS